MNNNINIEELNSEIKNLEVLKRYWELMAQIEENKYKSMVYKIKYFELLGALNKNEKDDENKNDNTGKDK